MVESLCRCGNKFSHKSNLKRKYCSVKCQRFFLRRNIRPSREELVRLVNEMSMVKIAKLYSVSDTAIRKWCDAEGIDLGNRRGFWAKRLAGSKHRDDKPDVRLAEFGETQQT
jgi:hypothetical protein